MYKKKGETDKGLGNRSRRKKGRGIDNRKVKEREQQQHPI